MKKISVCDFTLRKLAWGGASLLFREKIAIASKIDALGADTVELPPITRPKEDAIIYKTVCQSVKDAAVALPVGYTKEEIALAWDCISSAEKPVLQVALPVATAQMEYAFRAKEAAMLENVRTLVKLACEKCPTVEFAALDATRADLSFLVEACLAAKESGASFITLSDDAGQSLPEESAELVKAVKAQVDLPVYINLADNANMAVACALSAIRAGADGIKCSIVGDDILSTEKFAEAIMAKGASLGITTSLKYTEIHRDIKSTLGVITGEGVQSTPASQNDADEIFLDAESSLSDVCRAVSSLGYELSDEDCGKVFKALSQVCEKKNSIGAKELEALIASNAQQAPSTYHLLSYVANCSNIGLSMAQVSLEVGGETISGVATGDGPIDSAFRAIEQSVGYHYELDDFQIQAVTQGKEALGSALVRLRSNGKLYSGNGLSTDIVGASLRAYINALNKIVFEEN